MNWPPQRDSEADVSSVSPLSELTFRALALRQSEDKGLTLETSASESLYAGQFTLSTQLIKPNYLVFKNGLFTVTNMQLS